MENNKNPDIPQEDSLYSELLSTPDTGEEIGPDEAAIQSAGLIHPEDAEVDRIIQESKQEPDPEEIDMGATQIIAEFSDLPIPEEEAAENAIPEEQPDADADTPFLDDDFREAFGENGELLEEIFTEEEQPEVISSIPPLITEEAPDNVSQQPEEDDDEEFDTAKPKRRPKAKKGYGLLGIPHLLATVVWLAIAGLIGVSLGRMLWICAAEVLAFGREDQPISITITDEELGDIDAIAEKLKDAGLIERIDLFKFYADLTDAAEEISAGTFTLNSRYDYHALVKAMSFHSTARETVELLIPEGYSCAQIFALLEENKVCTKAELEEYAAEGQLEDYWFLEGVTRGDRYCLEGYLFPDTYEFYINDAPGRVLTKLLDNFDYRFTDIMKDKIAPLNDRMAAILADRGFSQEYIDAHKFTIREIIIIASMIEKETANDAESHDISSVIYNRLTNPEVYFYLNIDATIIYALEGNIDPVTGRTKPLTAEDLELDHPYNTYNHKGLIPGPISNPGRNSIIAALDPNQTNYYYYVYNPNTSQHIFAKNQTEHDKNVAYVKSLG